MMHKLRISSLNCRGLNNVEKILCLNDLLLINKIDICFIQETHFDSTFFLEKLEENFSRYNIFTNLSSNKSKGVAIIIKKCFQVENFSFKDNRIIMLDSIINGVMYNFVNIYAPNVANDQIKFIEILDNLVFDKKNLILGGDFNYVENNVLDRVGSKYTHESIEGKNQKIWRDFFKLHNIGEIINFHNEPDNMTWTNGSKSSRIDRFYTKSYIIEKMKYISNIHWSMSDHKMVISELDVKKSNLRNEELYSRSDTWKLNESILDDEYVNKQIIKLCEQIPSQKLVNEDWYEVFIEKVIKMLKRESRRIAFEKKQKIVFLFEKLILLNKSSKDEHITKEIHRIEEIIQQHYKYKREGIERRACEIKRNFIYQPSKILLEKEKNNGIKNHVDKYKMLNENTTEDPKEMIKDLHKFYNELMGKDKVNKNSFEKYSFKIKNIDKLYNEKERDFLLNKNISYEECSKCIKNMKPSAPGPNGLTIGFYKKYFEFFGEHFLELLNNQNKSLSDTFNKIKIKLIPKNNNKIKSVDDLRPIALTNLEYRIFTKILSNRLHIISNKLIKEHQTCSIKERKMNDNIILTRDLIIDSNLKKKTLNILSVDQRKAFDSISHEYLFKLLKHLNLGDFIYNNITRLYEKSYANIYFNGLKSENFQIKSGIKQGCALSMMLYVIAIEELLLRINDNKRIKGYVIKIFDLQEIKTSAYADDVVGYVRDESSIKEFFCEFDEWGKISGAQINKNKTKIMKLNNILKYNSDSEIQQMKILGVIFNKSGVANINLTEIKEKIRKSVYTWSNVDLDMLQRIVACKTFMLSKLWFITQFIYIEKKFLKEINSIVFKFIWGNSFELLKRNTMILPSGSGGLGIFHIEAKLETISMQQFNYITRNYNRVCYNLSVYWLKQKLRSLNFKNYNIIPEGSDKERPKVYSFMIRCMEKYKKINTKYTLGAHILNSKIMYINFRKKYEERPKYEKLNIKMDWKLVNSKLMNKRLDSKLREINFRVLNNCLNLNIKYPNKFGQKCFLCRKKVETLEHLFITCHLTKKFFDNVKTLLGKHNLLLNEDLIYYSSELDSFENVIIAIFKLCVWKIRNYKRIKEVSDDIAFFKNLFNKNIIKFKAHKEKKNL